MSARSTGRGGRGGRGRARWRPANPLRREMAALLDGGHDPTAMNPTFAVDALGSYPPLKEGVARISKPIGENDKTMLSVYRELNDAVRNSPYYVVGDGERTTAPLRYREKKKLNSLRNESLWDGKVPWVYKSLCPDDLLHDNTRERPLVKRRRVERNPGEQVSSIQKKGGKNDRTGPNVLSATNGPGTRASNPPLDEMADKEKDDGDKDPTQKKTDAVEEDLENEHEDDQAYLEEDEGDFDPANMFDDDDGYLSDDSGRDLPVL